jgi:hypothetical protein
MLARLYTDAALRARFFDDPEAVGAELGLGWDDLTRLGPLSEAQVGRFARSLWSKRRKEVEKALPLTLLALGEDRFATLFLRHASGPVPSGVQKHRADAIAFAAFLEDEADAGHLGPAWVVDLMRYEAARLLAWDSTRRWLVLRLRHTLDDLVQAALGGGDPAPRSCPTLAVWFRPTRRGQLRNVALSLPRWRSWIDVAPALRRLGSQGSKRVPS